MAENVFEALTEFRAAQDQAVADVSDTVSTVQQSTDTLSGFFATPRIVPAYAGYGTDDSCFHHTLVDGTSTPALGQILLAPIKVGQDRPYSAVKFGIDNTTMTNFYIALFSCDQATGLLTKVLDLGDCKSYLNIGYDQQVVPLPLTITVQRGELYYVGFLQVGGTAAPMHRWNSTNNWATGLYPQYLGNAYNVAGNTAFPSTIAAADMSAGIKYYAALGDLTSVVTPPLAFYSDGFNRADGALGAAWNFRTGNEWTVAGNVAQPAQGFLSQAGWHTYNSRATSLNQRVRMRPTGILHGQTSAATNSGYTTVYRFGLRGDGLGRSVICNMRLVTPANAGAPRCEVQIVTCADYGQCATAGTVRATAASGGLGYLTNADMVFRASGSVYEVIRNGVVIASWNDSGAVYPLTNNCTEQGFGGGGSGNTMCFDDWEGGDY